MNNKGFEEYLTNFDRQNSLEKRHIIVEQLKIINKFTSSMCTNLNLNPGLISNLRNNNTNDEDFYHDLIILINSMQDSLCNFSDKFTDIMEYVINK